MVCVSDLQIPTRCQSRGPIIVLDMCRVFWLAIQSAYSRSSPQDDLPITHTFGPIYIPEVIVLDQTDTLLDFAVLFWLSSANETWQINSSLLSPGGLHL